MKPKKLINQNKVINEDIDLAISQFKNEVINLLLKNGLMIPTKEQLSSIGIIPEGKNIIFIYLFLDFYI